MRLAFTILACAIGLSSVAQAGPANNDGTSEADTKPPRATIQKRQKQNTEFADYATVRDKVYKPKAFVNHDDSVQKRDSGTRPNLGSGNQKPDNSLKPINCTHPAYKTLCAEIKKSVGNGGSAPSATYKWVTVYSNSTGTSSYNIPSSIRSKATNYQFTVDGQTFSNPLGFSKTFPKGDSGRNYCGSWQWSTVISGYFPTNGQIRLPGKWVSYTVPRRQSGDCRSSHRKYEVKLKITRIRAYVKQ